MYKKSSSNKQYEGHKKLEDQYSKILEAVCFWKRKVSIERMCNTAQYVFMCVCTLNRKFSNENIAKFRK